MIQAMLSRGMGRRFRCRFNSFVEPVRDTADSCLVSNAKKKLSKIPLGVKPKRLRLEQLGRSLYTHALAIFLEFAGKI